MGEGAVLQEAKEQGWQTGRSLASEAEQQERLNPARDRTPTSWCSAVWKSHTCVFPGWSYQFKRFLFYV